ncbi:MAG: site-specific DNA-methyltransferase [Candidatus Aenigmarchaeota archaeon]|nr:site-specific DNA-methyltransferase [Candidatus Aenigmarchaeota archaeon]
MKKQNGTETSSFGTSGRFNHDSSKFYSSKMYSDTSKSKLDHSQENPISEKIINKIFCKSSEKMEELPDNSIHLMITSPPYNVGKEYDENLSIEDYRSLLKSVVKEVHRVLVVGGRACINVANLGRKPYIPLHSFIIEDMLNLGFFMRGEIIWNKGSSAGTSMAWGSWLSATNPTLRDIHEYILIFSKGNNGRLNLDKKESTITKEEFMEFTKSVWSFPTQSARAVGHPAPFPIELPLRLIKFYTFKGDVVLDPFVGSGTTAIAARKLERKYVGYDISKEYCKLAETRIKKEFAQKTLRVAV